MPRSWLRKALLLAEALALVNCGTTIAARIPRITTTIRISTSVKPRHARGRCITEMSDSDRHESSRRVRNFHNRRRRPARVGAVATLLVMLDHHLGNNVAALPAAVELARRAEGAVDVLVAGRWAALWRVWGFRRVRVTPLPGGTLRVGATGRPGAAAGRAVSDVRRSMRLQRDRRADARHGGAAAGRAGGREAAAGLQPAGAGAADAVRGRQLRPGAARLRRRGGPTR